MDSEFAPLARPGMTDADCPTRRVASAA